MRAVVLSGEGRAFCAGLDFGGFQAMAGGGEPARRRQRDGRRARIGDTDGRITHLGQQAAYVWQELPVPVIAAVHGVALGGGLQIALGADIRIVAPDAQLSVLEIRWGLMPDMTGTPMLPRLVGLDVAKELTFTGRMVSRRGGGARSASPPASPTTRAPTRSRWPPRSPARARTRCAGRQAAAQPVGHAPLAEELADERGTIGSLIGSPNQVEAVKAYFEKSAPRSPDLSGR